MTLQSKERMVRKMNLKKWFTELISDTKRRRSTITHYTGVPTSIPETPQPKPTNHLTELYDSLRRKENI